MNEYQGESYIAMSNIIKVGIYPEPLSCLSKMGKQHFMTWWEEFNNNKIIFSIYNPKEKYDMIIDCTDGAKLYPHIYLKCITQKQILIHYMWESPLHKNYSQENSKKLKNIYDYIITWDDDLSDDNTYYSFKYPCFNEKYYDKSILNQDEYESKKLLVMINSYIAMNYESALYMERIKIVNFFEEYNIFDLYGRGWNQYKDLKNYKGSPENKYEVYKNYKFAFCLENYYGRAGYITEKIFDAFMAGIVPVYKGASNISDYVPEDTFIDYDNFTCLEHLIKYLENIPLEEYNQYLSNINDYLNSDKVKVFSKKTHIFSICGIIENIYAKGRITRSFLTKCCAIFKILPNIFDYIYKHTRINANPNLIVFLKRIKTAVLKK